METRISKPCLMPLTKRELAPTSQLLFVSSKSSSKHSHNVAHNVAWAIIAPLLVTDQRIKDLMPFTEPPSKPTIQPTSRRSLVSTQRNSLPFPLLPPSSTTILPLEEPPPKLNGKRCLLLTPRNIPPKPPISNDEPGENFPSDGKLVYPDLHQKINLLPRGNCRNRCWDYWRTLCPNSCREVLIWRLRIWRDGRVPLISNLIRLDWENTLDDTCAFSCFRLAFRTFSLIFLCPLVLLSTT